MAQAPIRIPDPKRLAEAPLEAQLLTARALYRHGRFQEAAPIYERITPLMPDNVEPHLALSSLMTSFGDPKKAHALMADFYRRNPLAMRPPADVAPRPLALILRGFDLTYATIGKRSTWGYKPKLRGGHFSTRFLLAKDRIAQQRMTITEAGLQPDAVPEHDVILNTIAEPDIEGRSLKALQEYMKQVPGAKIINRPVPVWNTARDRNWQRLRDMEGVTFPETRRIKLEHGTVEEIERIIAELGMTLPVILRRTGTQTGRTTNLIRSRADIEPYAETKPTGSHYLIAYREMLWRGEFFRKLRLFHIDGEFYPVVCHLDRYWNVHGANRKEVMRTDETLMAEEKKFLADWRRYIGPANADRMYKIAERTDLEFFGIDFNIDDEGEIFIFELNAAMRHSFDHARNFPYKMPYDLATSEAFAQMVLRHAGAAPA